MTAEVAHERLIAPTKGGTVLQFPVLSEASRKYHQELEMDMLLPPEEVAKMLRIASESPILTYISEETTGGRLHDVTRTYVHSASTFLLHAEIPTVPVKLQEVAHHTRVFIDTVTPQTLTTLNGEFSQVPNGETLFFHSVICFDARNQAIGVIRHLSNTRKNYTYKQGAEDKRTATGSIRALLPQRPQRR